MARECFDLPRPGRPPVRSKPLTPTTSITAAPRGSLPKTTSMPERLRAESWTAQWDEPGWGETPSSPNFSVVGRSGIDEVSPHLLWSLCAVAKSCKLFMNRLLVAADLSRRTCLFSWQRYGYIGYFPYVKLFKAPIISR